MEQRKEQQKKYFVYLITNQINKKVYVGFTSNWKKRWKEHNLESQRNRNDQRNRHLYHAMRMYGRENFSFCLLCSVDDEKEALRLEQYYIEQYGSKNPDKGYNMTAGGDGVRVLRGDSLERMRKAVSERMSVPENTPNYREDISTEEIVELYVIEGLNTVAIGKKLGIYPGLVSSRLKRKGVKRRGRRIEINVAEVLRLYEIKKTAAEIGEIFGVSKYKILSVLKEQGIDRRRSGARKTTEGRKEKRCPGCQNIKLLSFFNKNKSSHDGYSSLCKQCISDRNKMKLRTKKEIAPEPCSSTGGTLGPSDVLGAEDSSSPSLCTSFSSEGSEA